MKTIWKFRLSITSPQRVEMPEGAEILTVQSQDGIACLWAMVDIQNANVPRYIEIHGTGNSIHESMAVNRKYIGTFQQPPFVWHVFERL